MKKTLEKIICNVLLAASLSFSGCAYHLSERDDSKHNNENHSNKIYTATEIRFNLDIATIDSGLSKESRKVPVHQADGGPSRGGVIVTNRTGPLRLGIGAERSIGTDKFRISIGGEAWVTPISDILDAYQTKQDLPSPYESYAYGGTFQRFALIPFLGIKTSLLDRIILDAEYGFPYSNFTFEKGHYRWDSYETIRKSSCAALGTSFSINLCYKYSPLGAIGIIYQSEDYDNTRLAGERTDISVNSFSLVVLKEF